MNQAEQAIAALRGTFLERLPSERAAIAAALCDAERTGLQHLAHRLAGSAGVFGFAALSRSAGAVDIALARPVPGAELAGKVDALVAEIDAALAGQ